MFSSLKLGRWGVDWNRVFYGRTVVLKKFYTTSTTVYGVRHRGFRGLSESQGGFRGSFWEVESLATFSKLSKCHRPNPNPARL